MILIMEQINDKFMMMEHINDKFLMNECIVYTGKMLDLGMDINILFGIIKEYQTKYIFIKENNFKIIATIYF